MAFTMERWHSAAGQRFSVRKYTGGPTGEELLALQAQADLISSPDMRIVIGQNEKAFAPVLFGTGRVKGASCFAAFLSKDGKSEAVGYLGEAFILECTAMGLGTCWLGMYNKKAVASSIELLEGEALTCITPIGPTDESYAARPRKGLDALTGMTQEELQALPEWQRYALECARMAPSATNKQPWAYHIDGENIHVRNTSANFGYGALDCGITMLHMELGAAHGGVAGDWVYEGDDAIFVPSSYEN